jgi:hypothetical protein
MSYVEDGASVLQLLNIFNKVEVVVLASTIYYDSGAIAGAMVRHRTLARVIVQISQWDHGAVQPSGPLGLSWDRVHFRQVILQDEGPAMQNMPIGPHLDTPTVHTLLLTLFKDSLAGSFPWTTYGFRGLHQLSFLDSDRLTWEGTPEIIEKFLLKHPHARLHFESLSSLQAISITGPGEEVRPLDDHPHINATDICLRKKHGQEAWYIAEVSAQMLDAGYLPEYSSSVIASLDSALPLLEVLTIVPEDSEMANLTVSI